MLIDNWYHDSIMELDGKFYLGYSVRNYIEDDWVGRKTQMLLLSIDIMDYYHGKGLMDWETMRRRE